MLLVIPSIEMIDGESSLCVSSEDKDKELYDALQANPLAMCKLFRRENSKALYIVDRDSLSGLNNYVNSNAILYLIDGVDIPIQVYSEFTNVEECRMFLNAGVYRVILGSLPFTDPVGVTKLIKEFTPSRVAFNFRVDTGFVYFQSVQKEMRDSSYATYIKSLGADRIIYSIENPVKNDYDILQDISEFSKSTGLKITLQDMCSTSKQLLKLNEERFFGVDSLILGKALYDNNFPCQKIWRAIESELEPEILANL